MDIALDALDAVQKGLRQLESAPTQGKAAAITAAEHKLAVAKRDVAVAEHKVAVAKMEAVRAQDGERSLRCAAATIAMHEAAVAKAVAEMATCVQGTSDFSYAREGRDFAEGQLNKARNTLAALSGEISSFPFVHIYLFVESIPPYISLIFLLCCRRTTADTGDSHRPRRDGL